MILNFSRNGKIKNGMVGEFERVGGGTLIVDDVGLLLILDTIEIGLVTWCE